MAEFPHDIKVLSLDLFDAAFPVPPEDEEAVGRRFMTLFEHERVSRRGAGASVHRVTNLFGETFALKRLHVAIERDDDPLDGAVAEQGGTPAQDAADQKSGESPQNTATAHHGNASPQTRKKELRTSISHSSGGFARTEGPGSGSTSITPDYVTQGHVAALYEEYRVQSALSGLRGFPKLHGFGLCGNDPVIIMEWVEGTLLRDCVKPFPVRFVADFGIAALSLLSRAAELSDEFVHRDISPRNIILRTDRASADEQLRTGQFDLCLIDFGSASLIASGNMLDPSFTMEKNIWRMGTPSYAPPEMLSSDINLPDSWRHSETIDTYALCSVLYELYTGEKPFRLPGADGMSPYRVKTETPPTPIAPREPDGGALAKIIATGLSVQQEDRPTVAELKAALENWKRLPSQRSIGALRGTRAADRSFWQPGYARKAITRRALFSAAIVAGAAVVSGAIIAQKTAGTVDSFDPARYTTTRTLYDGPPLFKAFDGEHPGWMLCTKDGDIACKPESSRECGTLREGLVALYDDISQRYGYITPGAHSADYAWAILPGFAGASDFSEGLAAAQDLGSKLWGFINSAGSWVIAPAFRSASSFVHGAAAVQTNDERALWGAIDINGAWTVEPQFNALGSRAADGCAVAEFPSRGSDAALAVSWGIVDAEGRHLCAPSVASLRSCAYGPAPALDTTSGLWGFIARDGSWAIEPAFMDARPFSPYNGTAEGGSSISSTESATATLAAVQDAKTQLWYFINRDGSPHADMTPRFWKLGDLSFGLAPAQASAKDSTVVFDETDPSSRVRGAGMRYGYVDANGEWQMKRLTSLTDTAIGPASI